MTKADQIDSTGYVEKCCQKGLWQVLLLKGLVGSILLWLAPLPLAPDEAQYWTWSRRLDWGYFSKPPGIAWQIAATCRLLQSHTPLAIRSGSLLLSLLTPMLFYRGCRRWGLQSQSRLLGGLSLALCPAGILGQFAATTDVGLLFALVGSLGPLGELSLSPKERGSPWNDRSNPERELGLWICLGALFKWTALMVFPLLIFSAHFWRRVRRYPHRILYLLGWTLVGLGPSLYWNLQHSGATFRHVLGQMSGTRSLCPPTLSMRALFVGQYVAGQIALLSPSLAWLFARCAHCKFPFFGAGAKVSPLDRSAARPAIILLVSFLLIALTRRVQANWTLCAYPLICLVLGARSAEKKVERQLIRAIFLSALFSTSALAVPYAQEAGLPLPWFLNGFQQCSGWPRLKGGLAEAGFDKERDFVVSDTYQLMAALSYYEFADTPFAPLYYFNLRGLRRNGYDQPHPIDRYRGQAALYATLQREFEGDLASGIAAGRARLAPYFERVEFATSRVLVEKNEIARRRVLYFRGWNYSGERPALGRTY